MGIRRNVLIQIKNFLHNKEIVLSGEHDIDTIGTGKILKAYNKNFDVGALTANPDNLPIVAVIPAPHSIDTHIYGRMLDSNYRVALFGFVAHSDLEELTLVGEDTIEFITQTLANWDNIEIMRLKRFSIVEFGPIINEFYSDEPCGIGYISIPLTIQFVDN